MRFNIVILTILSLLVSTTSYAGGLFGGLFGRRAQVAQVYYQPQQYQQTYQYQQPYQYQQYQAVAAIPLATIPIAVDLQAYMYSVNSNAFQSFRDYMNTKSSVPQEQPIAQSSPQQVAQAQAQSDDPRTLGFQVLAKNCKSCHSGSSPKAGFSIFDAKGSVLSSLPWGKILERVSSKDPEFRMPPGKSLRVEDILSLVSLASPPSDMVYNPADIGGSTSSASQSERVAFRTPFD